MHFIPPGREAELAGKVRHAQEALDNAEARLAGAQQAAAHTLVAVSFVHKPAPSVQTFAPAISCC